MQLNRDHLDRLYQRYGFSTNHKNQDTAVYILRHGYFLNAEIVPLASGIDCTSLRDEFQQAGYACQVAEFASIEEAEQRLFHGFFSTDATRKRLKAIYHRFVAQQTKSLGASYQYVPARFQLAGAASDESTGLIQNILGIANRNGSQLVVVEAAAGFGKTCTAYEIMAALLDDKSPRNPVFTELSRNRQAREFRYVLLDEIDHNYPSLTLDLVTEHIQKGDLPLIIDGFDELLSKTADSKGFDETESMLDTIGALLRKQAKVILTTRKTAIFAGDEFHKWIEKHAGKFAVTVFALEPPRLLDWLGKERYEQVTTRSTPVASLENPVILSYLRGLSKAEFVKAISDPDSIVDRYFTSLLEREQIRQALVMSSEEQLQVFRGLAQSMLEFDFTSESRDLIKELIIDRNRHLLEKARTGYPSTTRPTLDQLADTLATHALLDRVGREKNAVGFVNDFVLGTLLGDVVLSEYDDDWVGDEMAIIYPVTAYIPRSENKKTALHSRLKQTLEKADPQTQLWADISLVGNTERSYENALFDDLRIANCTLGEAQTFRGCQFLKCDFFQVNFVLHAFPMTGFQGCRFFECSVTIDQLQEDEGGRWVINSHSTGSEDVPSRLSSVVAPTAYAANEMQRKVLACLWPQEQPFSSQQRLIRSIQAQFPKNIQSFIGGAIEALHRLGLVLITNGAIRLNEKKVADIKSILQGVH